MSSRKLTAHVVASMQEPPQALWSAHFNCHGKRLLILTQSGAIAVEPPHNHTEAVLLAISGECCCVSEMRRLARSCSMDQATSQRGGFLGDGIQFHHRRVLACHRLGRNKRPFGNGGLDPASFERRLWNKIRRLAQLEGWSTPTHKRSRIGGLTVDVTVDPGLQKAELDHRKSGTVLNVVIDPSWATNVYRRNMQWARDSESARWAIIDAADRGYPWSPHTIAAKAITWDKKANQLIIAYGTTWKQPRNKWSFTPACQAPDHAGASTQEKRYAKILAYCPRDWDLVRELRDGYLLHVSKRERFGRLYAPHPYPPFTRLARFIPHMTMDRLTVIGLLDRDDNTGICSLTERGMTSHQYGGRCDLLDRVLHA